ncbi:hypothetical protein AB0362_05750 [Rhodococcus sp. NPDC079359]|uniref:hypothetical protein n=1 Tax=Rhodococcus sp. NPDC079359 TaxID=3154961 RepID=UPI0034500765
MTMKIWQLSESELLADAAAVSHRIQLLEARRIALVAENHPWFVPPATVDPYRQPRPSHARAGPHIA